MNTLFPYLTLALVLGFLFTPASAAAQPVPAPDEENMQAILDLMRSDTNPFKIRTLNQVMALTGPEAENFWPVYQQYEQELGAISKRATIFLREYRELLASGATADKRYNELARKWLKLREDRLALWAEYHKKISRAVSAYCAAQFLQVEHQMGLFIDLSFASEMPTITTQPVSATLKPTAAVPTREETVLVRITATVEAIDYEKREATLKERPGLRDTGHTRRRR